MPLVNTWIKNEDWNKYYQLASTKQWGTFVHKALNWKDVYGDTPQPSIANKELPKEPKIIKTKEEAESMVENLYCKGTHYMDRHDCGKGKCPWKGM
jgi:hypothetical protein